MHFSHPLTSLQSCSNAMLARRAIRMQTMNRKALISSPYADLGTRKQRRVKIACCCSPHQTNAPQAFDTGSGDKVRLPTQGESVVRGSGGPETMLQELPKPPADIDYLAVSPHHFVFHGQTLYCSGGFQQNQCHPFCRSSLQYSKVVPKILGSLGRAIWGFCTKI